MEHTVHVICFSDSYLFILLSCRNVSLLNSRFPLYSVETATKKETNKYPLFSIIRKFCVLVSFPLRSVDFQKLSLIVSLLEPPNNNDTHTYIEQIEGNKRQACLLICDCLFHNVGFKKFIRFYTTKTTTTTTTAYAHMMAMCFGCCFLSTFLFI